MGKKHLRLYSQKTFFFSQEKVFTESIIDGLLRPVERLNHIAMRQGCLLILSQITLLNKVI